MSPEPPAIQALDLRKVYDAGVPVTALDGVSFTVPHGSHTAVVGPSGSGKSTLLNLVATLDRPTGGRISVDGVDVTALSERERRRFRRRAIGFVFQTFNLLPRLSAVENVALPLLFDGWSRERRRSRARTLLERVDMADRAGARPERLSGGERQRVAIARALANDPPLLIADEPTGQLDQATGAVVLDLLEEVQADGRSLFIVSHDDSVATRADQVLHCVDGRIHTRPKLVA